MNLFADFEKLSKQAWKNQAITDLKGKNFEESLTSKTIEGLLVNPYFDASDLENKFESGIQDAQQVDSQAKRTWLLEERIVVEKNKDTQVLIQKAIEGGANSFDLVFSESKISEIDIQKTLKNVKLNETPCFFEVDNPVLFTNALLKFINYQMKGGIWFNDNETIDWPKVANLIELTKNSPKFRCITIRLNDSEFETSKPIQNLALLVQKAIIAIDELSELGLDIKIILENIQFELKIGQDFFTEIASIRALKYLFSEIILQNYQLQTSVFVRCKTDKRIDDLPNHQLIAATYASTAAILGGCDVLQISVIDKYSHQSDEFARRISRNISLILEQESFLSATTDPAAGSYFIENLTFQISQKVLEKLQEIDRVP